MNFITLISEGSLISADLISEIAAGTAPGQKPDDFGLKDKIELNNEIASCWSASRDFWAALQIALKKVKETETGATPTRDLWMLPLLRWLGFENVQFSRSSTVIGSRTYAISHREGSVEGGVPIHIEGVNTDIDKRPESGRPRIAPHSLLQEYLNRSENLWGILSNGRKLRILRDSARLSKPSYLEFDLEQMMVGERFVEFQLLFRILHRSRWSRGVQTEHECLLERYYQDSIEAGGRVREKLREGVENAVKILGDGFLKHPLNASLSMAAESGELDAPGYYREILRLIYRWLFLMVSEERNLVGPEPENDRMRKIYERHYSISRLRQKVERPVNAQDRHWDLWEGVKQTFLLYQDSECAEKLQVAPLNGDLFGKEAMPHLMEACLSNTDLLRAFQNLSLFRENHTIRRINYALLDVEELGSVYESLLDYHPLINRNGEAGLSFELASGSERKNTGSYYTQPELVAELIKSGLEPVIEDRLSSVGDVKAQEEALLSLKICDPAAGSGHFLLAAARRVGHELAKVRLGEEHPTLNQTRLAIRDVIQRCIYGVDLNPLAVDLCKVALWLEGHNRGLPLTFLDHRVKCGNSLIGIDNLNRIAEGISDGAYQAVTGDSSSLARKFMLLNKKEQRNYSVGQMRLNFDIKKQISLDAIGFDEAARGIELEPECSLSDVNSKKLTYENFRKSKIRDLYSIVCNVWTTAFFQPYIDESDQTVITHYTLMDVLCDSRTDLSAAQKANYASRDLLFFHWPLEFPDVFSNGGFDVVFCCPPWRTIRFDPGNLSDKIQGKTSEQETGSPLFFPQDTGAKNTAQSWFQMGNPKFENDATRRFVKHSGRFPHTGSGGLVSYGLFVEACLNLINSSGRIGVIVPTSIGTDAAFSKFFDFLTTNRHIVSFFDFENTRRLFSEVITTMKFCLLTLSKQKTYSPLMAFFLTGAEDLGDERRLIRLSEADLDLMNPNTRNLPVPRNHEDENLLRRIYKKFSVIINEKTRENPWTLSFSTLYQITSDRSFFSDREESGLELLYEGKMIHQFDCRWASYEEQTNVFSKVTLEQKIDPTFSVKSRYWVSSDELSHRLSKIKWPHRWLICFRDVARATDERTSIFSVVPWAGCSHPLPIVSFQDENLKAIFPMFVANCNSLVFDYVLRLKFAGHHLVFSIFRQLPILSPQEYSTQDVEFISKRVLELAYTCWSLQPFAKDMGYEGPPFEWDAERRSILRAELDAYYAFLYGLTRNELSYILDPQEVYGIDFPGETFRILRDKEMRLHGEFKTRRLVIEAWDRLFG